MKLEEVEEASATLTSAADYLVNEYRPKGREERAFWYFDSSEAQAARELRVLSNEIQSYYFDEYSVKPAEGLTQTNP